MARKRQFQELYVYMNGIQVGILTRAATGNLTFIYCDGWLSWRNARPISISMPLTEVPYSGRIVDSYFDNLLPDNELIRERIQARFSAPSKKCFDLLSYIGSDCVGALQLLTEPKITDIKKIQAAQITDHEIADLLKHYRTAPLGMDRNFDFRISIAGAQEKTALLMYENKWHIPHGITPTSHIIKLPIGKIQPFGIDLSESIENEWLCLNILSAYNLPVNQSKIVRFDDITTLVVKRFDRKWSGDKQWLIRLPQEDLCQALGKPSGLKYEAHGGPSIHDILTILSGSNVATADRYQFMKSVFLFWILGAIDGHAKNFSIFLEAQGRYRLTPLYDVMSAYPIVAKKQMQQQDLKMAMALTGKNRHYHWHTIQLRHWLSTARQCRFPERIMQSIIEEVCDNMEKVISDVADILPHQFPQYISEPIFSGMRKIKHRGK